MGDELVDQVMEESKKSRLNTVVAILVSLTAAFLAVAHVKSDNIVQRIYMIQSETVDTWAYYQAKGTKENMALMMVDQLQAMKDLTTTPEAKTSFDTRIKAYEEKAGKYEKEKAEIEKKAKDLGIEQDGLMVHHDQFDLSEATVSLALALFAMTALTQKKWLLALAILLVLYGGTYGLAGLCGWQLHPGAFVGNLLG